VVGNWEYIEEAICSGTISAIVGNGSLLETYNDNGIPFALYNFINSMLEVIYG
jgi:hypothetical protein